mgnify:CR=1 FL=1
MALMPAYFTTTKLGNRKSKSKTAKQIQAEIDHEKFLRKLGYKPNTDKSPKILKSVSSVSDERKIAKTSDTIPGFAPKAKEKVYSGQRRLLGIATMHKSNMVPVFADNKQVAEDIAKMRRG